jgi:4-amino-4-deoxy-L-arabinose transferase-like glycosyltransferase
MTVDESNPEVSFVNQADPKPRGYRGWEIAAYLGVILLAAGLRIWGLEKSGVGNPYYGAAVRSMLASPTNFLFASFDPAGTVSVDKPPVALWIQAASAKVFGYHGLAILMPQVIMGVVSVGLTMILVRRAFGSAAGLLAGLALALTPICVAMDRDNLPDTALTLVLLLAAGALMRASETGRSGSLMLAMALVGLAFNIKMLAAFVVLPTFALAFALAAPLSWRAKVGKLAISGLVLAAVSLSWPIVVELIPKSERPYIGGSQNNSALELALGYNGLARIMGGFGPGGPRGSRGDGPGPIADRKAASEGVPKRADGPGVSGPGGGRFPGGGGPFRGGMPGFGGTPGPLRFANVGMAGLITWLFPVAIVGGLAATLRRWRSWPTGAEHIALTVWGGWFVTHWVVFSFAQGIFHEYYTAIMGPAVAALAGIGFVTLVEEGQRGGWRGLLLPATLLITAAWQASIVRIFPDWARWLVPTLVASASVAAVAFLVTCWRGRRTSTVVWPQVSAAVGFASLMIGPMLWSLCPVLGKPNVMLPQADPSLLGVARATGVAGPPSLPGIPGMMEMDPKQTRKLAEFLRSSQRGEAIAVATLSSMTAAPLIIEEGLDAVSIGGFMGGDRVWTKDQFVKKVEEGQLRYFLFGGGPGGPGGPPGPGGGPPGGMPFGPPGGGPPGGGPPGGPGGMGNREILAWIRENGTPVDPKLWKVEDPDQTEDEDDGPPAMPGDPGFDPARMARRMRRMIELYDCRPLEKASKP